MEIWNAEVLYETDLQLGEGAIWHDKHKQFLYVDILNGIVGCIDPATKVVMECNVGKKVGTVVPANDGDLIVALQGSVEVLNFATGALAKLTDIEADKPFNRCNDGKCDAAGRLWVGTMHMDAKLNEGALYRYDGELKKMIAGTSVSNGICWSPDKKTMYYIDSFDHNIKAYDFDLASGEITNGHVAVNITGEGVVPDGMCMDTEGMIWVAIWGGGCVNRYNPCTGEMLGQAKVDAPLVASCAFGGTDMRQLFITTARDGLTAGQLEQYPCSGSLFIVNTGHTGLQTNYFNLSNKYSDKLLE